MSEPLSPAAQAVFDVVNPAGSYYLPLVAAALRASVDSPPNVKVPTINIPEGTNSIEDIAFAVAGAVAQATSQAFIDHIGAIADELSSPIPNHG